jgi:protocatechuate 3,4-dioxygenase beta subunit
MHNDHPHGLQADWPQLQEQARRRKALRWLGGLGLAGSLPLLGCGGGGDANAGTTTVTGTGTGTGTNTGSCSAIPDETAGPYPGDGTNASGGSIANALTLTDIVRRDIRSSIGGATGTAGGIPLTVTLTLVNANNSCALLSGYAVYLWHCTREGGYSLYSTGVTGENFLRGVQVSDANGQLTFQTIFPGCYSGRWPHIHFEVFRTLGAATSGANDIKTSQLALPQAACSTVYAGASGYSASVANLAAISLASDNVFSNDGAALQLATVTGDLVNGYAASLTVGVAG